jgi:hypothetical protein
MAPMETGMKAKAVPMPATKNGPGEVTDAVIQAAPVARAEKPSTCCM